jgi:ABC-2 type transport system ATP-binding protein
MNIKIDGLSKSYDRKVHALKKIDLELGSGILGLVGPNGAGKTTLMRILATMLEPSTGSVKFGDLDLRDNRREVRAMLGYLPQQFSRFSRLKTREFLDYSARLCGIRDGRARKSRVDQMLETVGLFEARDRLANRLSGGMKRRLGIAQALIGNPRVLIVDEPTTGLDPEERLRFRNLLSDMIRDEIVVILSTHIVGDISSACSRMIMLNRGEMVFDGSPAGLIGQARGNVWQVAAEEDELETLRQKYSVVSTVPSGNGWEVTLVSDKGVEGYPAQPLEPTLEHAYVYLLEYKLGERREDDSL